MAIRARRSRAASGEVPYRFSADEVLAFAEHLRHDAELRDGVLYRRVKKELHNFIVAQAADLLRPLLPLHFHLREEKSCRDGEWSLPEPDIAVARGSRSEALPGPPPLSGMALIVEVDHHSTRLDHGAKLRRSAESGVPVYWVVEASGRSVFVYERPGGEGDAAGYAIRTRHRDDDRIPVVVDGSETGRIRASDLFPPSTFSEQ